MYTILLIVHIASMIASLALMSSALIMGMYGKDAAARVATVGMMATTTGGASGTVLLIDAPLSFKCALLTAYLLSITMLYIFGFGMGRVNNARLIRHSAVVQKS
jgi:hypothetical protein